MKRTKNRTSEFVSACACILLLVMLTGCGFLRRPAPPVDRSQDPRIRREVEARLAAEPALRQSELRVDVDGAIVILYGSVPGIEGWNCAVRNAQLVPGVASVVDYLVIERTDEEVVCIASRDLAT